MARDFTSASTQYLYRTTAVITTHPLTFACWFRAHDVTAQFGLMAVAPNVASNNISLRLRGDVVGDPVEWHTNGTALVQVQTTTGFSVNTWHHACGVTASDTSRAVYIDGGSKNTSGAGSAPPGSMTRTSIAAIVADLVYHPL